MRNRYTTLITGLFTSALILPANNVLAQCGPGAHWVDNCPGGQDTWEPFDLTVNVDINGDCQQDFTMYNLNGSALVHHSSPLDDSQNYPGIRPLDGHMDVIDVEIISMSLTNGSQTVIAGGGQGQGGNLAASLGTIAEAPDFTNADSFFDLFCEAYMSGMYLYNQTPMRFQSVIGQIPPYNTTYTFDGCVPAYTSPIPGQGQLVGNIVHAQLTLGNPPVEVPTLSEWGLLIFGLLLLAFGTMTIVMRKKSALKEAA